MYLHLGLACSRPCVVNQPDDGLGQRVGSSRSFWPLKDLRPRVQEDGDDHVRPAVFQEKDVVQEQTGCSFVA